MPALWSRDVNLPDAAARWALKLSVVTALLVSPTGTPAAQPTSSEPVAGILRVKLTQEARRRVEIDVERGGGFVQLGLRSWDALTQEAGVLSIRAQRFALLHRGLDDAIGVSRWLTLQLPSGTDPRPWVRRFRDDENVENVSLAFEVSPH
jgi:hypothetical protein